jgi:DNA polymerase III epsilon subunit-like protein
MIFTVIDTETTGLDRKKHEIIEIAFISYIADADGNEYVLKKFEQKISPEAIHLASSKALEINGYTEDKWINSVNFKEIYPELKKMLSESDFLIGQNLIFDLNFIQTMCERNDLEALAYPPYVDTKSMADELKWAGVLKRSRMDYLCEHFKIQWTGDAHTALADCERTMKVFEKLQDEVKGYEFYTFEDPYRAY